MPHFLREELELVYSMSAVQRCRDGNFKAFLCLMISFHTNYSGFNNQGGYEKFSEGAQIMMKDDRGMMLLRVNVAIKSTFKAHLSMGAIDFTIATCGLCRTIDSPHLLLTKGFHRAFTTTAPLLSSGSANAGDWLQGWGGGVGMSELKVQELVICAVSLISSCAVVLAIEKSIFSLALSWQIFRHASGVWKGFSVQTLLLSKCAST